jgi:hypothetical protein
MNPSRVLSGNINPYSGNAVVFDTTPALNYALQQEAKQKAAQDAVDKHLLDMQNVDTKGMRPQDQQIFANNFDKDVTQFYKQNYDLMRQNTPEGRAAKMELQKRINDKKNEVGESLYAKDLEKQVGGVIAGKRLTSGQLAMVEALNKSIYDQTHYKDPFTKKRYGVADIGEFEKPFEPEKFKKDILGANIMGEETKVGEPKLNTQTGKLEYKTSKGYVDKSYNNILETAGVLASSPQYNRFFEQEIINTGQLPQVQKAYEDYYKKPMQPTKENVAKGWALLQIPKSIEGRKEEDAFLYKTNVQEAKQKRMYDYTQKPKEQYTNEILKNIKINSVPFAEKEPYAANEQGSWYETGMRIADISPTLAKALTTQITNSAGELVDVSPNSLIISPDGKSFAPRIRQKRYVVERNGKYSTTDKEGKKVTADTQGAVLQEVTLKPEFWMTESNLAAEIQKTFPKGEGNVNLEYEGGGFKTPMNKNETPKKTQSLAERMKLAANKPKQ